MLRITSALAIIVSSQALAIDLPKKCKITLDQYESISTGQSIAEVQEKLRCLGDHTMDHSIHGHKSDGFQFSGRKIGSAATVIFGNGKVTSKMSAGL